MTCALSGALFLLVQFISFIMNIVSQPIDQIGSVGIVSNGLRLDDRATQCYLGAAVVGGAVVVTSIGITTMAAPAVTLAPIAGAVGLWIAGDRVRDNASTDAKTDTPVTETAAA